MELNDRNPWQRKAARAWGILCLAVCLPVGSEARNVCLSTPNTSLVLDVEQGEEPKYVYYGRSLSPLDVENIGYVRNCDQPAYPAYGLDCPHEAAFAVRHSDGNLSTQLEVCAMEEKDTGEARTLSIRMKDKVYDFYVTLYYKAYRDVDIIEAWSSFRNEEKGEVVLGQFASAYLPVRRGDVWLSRLYGAWANEARLVQESLRPGMEVIQNKDGVRNSHTAHAEVMFSLDGRPQEDNGRVIGAALCYGGNYKLRVNTDESEYHHFFAGINEDRSSWHLGRGEDFTTPPLALTFSSEGLGQASRNFHRWGRKYKLAHGDRERKILLNSWEGVYFKINEEGMEAMMSDIAAMGGELFVMDDGWFGGKYPRNSDKTSLGDWVTDRRKLPGGVGKLLREAEKRGIKFGIWIEPEMTNTRSELYEKHPDWIVQAPGREPVTGRGGTQLVLDLSNPDVQDYVFGVVDGLMTKYPGIDYIKWDANMGILNHGSHYLEGNRQSHLYIAYHRGFEAVCRRIREKYPDLTLQACAQGGGRANYGVLPYFDEFWVSDNTDALQRIYMQWGTSYFFPAMAMASHISAASNHQTFRTVPLKFRIDVAMSGRLGMEIQPKDMTEEEKEMCRRAIADYKTIRPVVQKGDLYRLLSPYEGLGAASLMYVSQDKAEAVFYWWKTEHFMNQHLPRVRMSGLDAEKNYRIRELNRIDNQPLPYEGKVVSGAFLMANGLELPYVHQVERNRKNAYSSRVIYLEDAGD